jgi:hypothetical protein
MFYSDQLQLYVVCAARKAGVLQLAAIWRMLILMIFVHL